MVCYNQRDAFQPANFTYSNFGPKWTLDWLSYITDDPSSPNADVQYYRMIMDPFGNTLSLSYDASLRIVAVTDAIGQIIRYCSGSATPSVRCCGKPFVSHSGVRGACAGRRSCNGELNAAQHQDSELQGLPHYGDVCVVQIGMPRRRKR